MPENWPAIPRIVSSIKPQAEVRIPDEERQYWGFGI